MKDVLWFKHDMNARNDVRLVKLRAKCGWEGYGFYFAMIEIMGETYEYKIQDDGELSETIACLLGIDIEKATKFLNTTISVGLFKIEEGFLFSDSFIRRMSQYVEKSKKLSDNGRKGGLAKAIAKQNSSNCQANALADKTRLDKNRLEEIKTPIKVEYCEHFNIFWEAYPKKVGKDSAYELWGKVHPNIEDCLAALKWQKISNDWTKEEGKYIPSPSSWLKGGRWKDENPNKEVKSKYSHLSVVVSNEVKK